MLKLLATDCHWIKPGDQPTDMCAHSPVELTISGISLSTHEDGDWCVSAAAVHLLRTLRRSHTTDAPVAEHLIPCCGHTMVDAGADSEDDVLIIGCNQGVDWEIIHNNTSAFEFRINESTVSIAKTAWRDAVLQFSDNVRQFYINSTPRSDNDEWAYKGYQLMICEWDRRRADAESVA